MLVQYSLVRGQGSANLFIKDLSKLQVFYDDVAKVLARGPSRENSSQVVAKFMAEKDIIEGVAGVFRQCGPWSGDHMRIFAPAHDLAFDIMRIAYETNADILQIDDDHLRSNCEIMHHYLNSIICFFK